MASPWQRISMAYARAVIAADGDDPDAAEAAFSAALAADLQRWPLPRARLLLAYGSWLRRQRRVVESRTPLRTARDLFDAMGVAWMGERARRELGASGEASRARGAHTLDELTPQELQIARLAADGLSNREIGERLYLSHRTVGFHLYHVYPKLGVSSRAQLHAALAS
jgi:DNA-binding NarL/FixJ family response regulator